MVRVVVCELLPFRMVKRTVTGVPEPSGRPHGAIAVPGAITGLAVIDGRRKGLPLTSQTNSYVAIGPADPEASNPQLTRFLSWLPCEPGLVVSVQVVPVLGVKVAIPCVTVSCVVIDPVVTFIRPVRVAPGLDGLGSTL